VADSISATILGNRSSADRGAAIKDAVNGFAGSLTAGILKDGRIAEPVAAEAGRSAVSSLARGHGEALAGGHVQGVSAGNGNANRIGDRRIPVAKKNAGEDL